MRKLAYEIPVASDQGFLLCPRPTLELSLRIEGFIPRWKICRPHQLYGSPPCCISPQRPIGVLSHARFEIIGMAGVIRSIRAADHVGPEAHRCALGLRL